MDERLFRTFLTNGLGFVNGCYVEKGVKDRHTELLGVPAEAYEVCQEVE